MMRTLVTMAKVPANIFTTSKVAHDCNVSPFNPV
jgi:hypothetical protein